MLKNFEKLIKEEMLSFVKNLDSDIFAISHQTVELFDYEECYVKDLFDEIQSHISNEYLEAYKKDLENLSRSRKSLSNVYLCQFKDTASLLYCDFKICESDNRYIMGLIRNIDTDYVVNGVIKRDRENSFISALKKEQAKNRNLKILFCSFNNFSIVNEQVSKKKADLLMEEIFAKIKNTYKIDLFRLYGVKFAIIVPNDMALDTLIQGITSIANEKFEKNHVNLINPIKYATYKCKGSMEKFNISNVYDLIKENRDWNYENFEIIDEKLSEVKNNSSLIMALNKSIINNFENFRIVIQPIVNITDYRVESAEILLRYTKKGVNISPATFIPLLEKNGLIVKVGNYVIEESAKLSCSLKKMKKDIKLHINVSYIQILNEHFTNFIQEILEKYHLSGREFVFELTETKYNSNPEKLKSFFNYCHSLNIQTAVDDFGAGFSSIELLFDTISDVIKLDKSLLNKMKLSKENELFVKDIVSACHRWEKWVCIEGVETEYELTLAKRIEVDAIQGYYFSKPVEIYEFAKIVGNMH